MLTYLPDTDVTVTIPLKDADGNDLTASAVSYRVLDESDTEIVALASLGTFVEGDSEATVVVPAISNALAEGQTRAGRMVELVLTLENGNVTLQSFYELASTEPALVIPDTSFVTYTMALMLAKQTHNLPGWDAATQNDRVSALYEAKVRLSKLRYRYRWDNWQSKVEPDFSINDISAITLTEFYALSDQFRNALQRAQVVEADYILGGAQTELERESGLMSKTVGESSQMWRPGKSVRLAVSKRAMELIGKYVNYTPVIGRA